MTAQPSSSRVIFAFCTSLLVAVGAVTLATCGSPSSEWGACAVPVFCIGLLVALPLGLFVAAPMYLILRFMHWTKFWQLCLAGAFCAVAPMAAFSGTSAFERTLLLVAAGAGFLGGALVWLLAYRGMGAN